MRCSSDLRKRVLGFVADGGRKADAASRFQVGIASVYRWLKAEDGLAYRRPGPRGPRRIDGEALRAQVKAHPDWTLQQRARALGVSRNGVWCALRRLGIRRKKNAGLIGSATRESGEPTGIGETARNGGGRFWCTRMKAGLNPAPTAAMPMALGGRASRAWSPVTSGPGPRCSPRGSDRAWKPRCFLTAPATPPCLTLGSPGSSVRCSPPSMS